MVCMLWIVTVYHGMDVGFTGCVLVNRMPSWSIARVEFCVIVRPTIGQDLESDTLYGDLLSDFASPQTSTPPHSTARDAQTYSQAATWCISGKARPRPVCSSTWLGTASQLGLTTTPIPIPHLYCISARPYRNSDPSDSYKPACKLWARPELRNNTKSGLDCHDDGNLSPNRDQGQYCHCVGARSVLWRVCMSSLVLSAARRLDRS